MHADGRHDFIALRIDHADAVGLRVDHVNFVFLSVGGNSSRFIANSNRLCGLKSAQVNHRDGVALAVGDVGVLAIGGAVGGELALPQIPPSQTPDNRKRNNEEKKFSQANGLMADRMPDCADKASDARGWFPIAGTILPTTGAICRTCFISSSNCSG